jgi:hypothetical protein
LTSLSLGSDSDSLLSGALYVELLTTVDFDRGVASGLTSKTGLRCAGKFSDFPGIKYGLWNAVSSMYSSSGQRVTQRSNLLSNQTW